MSSGRIIEALARDRQQEARDTKILFIENIDEDAQTITERRWGVRNKLQEGGVRKYHGPKKRTNIRR